MTIDSWLTQFQENGYRLTGARRAVVEIISSSAAEIGPPASRPS